MQISIQVSYRSRWSYRSKSFIAIRGGRVKGHAGRKQTAGRGRKGHRHAKRRTASEGRRREAEGPWEVRTTAFDWPAKSKDHRYAHSPNHKYTHV